MSLFQRWGYRDGVRDHELSERNFEFGIWHGAVDVCPEYYSFYFKGFWTRIWIFASILN
jgi:hypothetical protein